MQPSTDRTMQLARKQFEESDLSLDDLGLKMGYPKESARKSAWQFLNHTNDPRLSMLLKFCKALGISVKELM